MHAFSMFNLCTYTQVSGIYVAYSAITMFHELLKISYVDKIIVTEVTVTDGSMYALKRITNHLRS